MTRLPRSSRRPSRRPAHRWGAATVLAGGALVAGTLAAAGPAQSVPFDPCPPPVAPSALTPGESVHGLTTVSGTTPETFSGTVTGVLTAGIAPGVDLILMDLHSQTIDRAGIWEGMSGSPVYDDQDDLVGAVSYSLSLGPSTVAGVTPAPAMTRLLSPGGVQPGALARRVAVPGAVARRLVSSGAATTGQVAGGLSQLRMPLSVSGLSATRLRQLAPELDLGGGHAVSTTPGVTASADYPVVAGGNLAASLSYGTVTAAGLGTATMVCGDQVVGFGHPMDYTGPSNLTMHGASTVLVQDDPTLTSYKIANLGAPVGAITDDRLTGIHGTTGALPTSTGIAASTEQGTEDFTGWTHVSDPSVLPELGYLTVLASQEKVMDRIGKGSVAATWTIHGIRANGDPFRLHRRDVYTNSSDVSSASASALAGDLSALQQNEAEAVTITAVREHSAVSDDDATYTISRVQSHALGTWQTLRPGRPAVLRAGHVARLRVTLVSRTAAQRVVVVRVFVPVHAAGQVGRLTVLGGNQFSEDSEEFFDDEELDLSFGDPGTARQTFPQILKGLTAGPQHNQVEATLVFRRAPGAAHKPRTGTATLKRVVSGQVDVPVLAVR